MNLESCGSVEIGVIDPNNIDSALLDKMNIDLGMRVIVTELLRHGYNTAFSCEGEDGGEPYVAFKRGTGDGTFEGRAENYGFKPRQLKPCCARMDGDFCGRCGASRKFVVYDRSSTKPFTIELGGK